MTASRTADAIVILLGLGPGSRSGSGFGSLASFFLSLDARLLGRSFFGLAVLIRAAALVLGLVYARAVVPTARFFQRGKACLFRFAQQASLHFLARGNFLRRAQAPR